MACTPLFFLSLLLPCSGVVLSSVSFEILKRKEDGLHKLMLIDDNPILDPSFGADVYNSLQRLSPLAPSEPLKAVTLERAVLRGLTELGLVFAAQGNSPPYLCSYFNIQVDAETGGFFNISGSVSSEFLIIDVLSISGASSAEEVSHLQRVVGGSLLSMLTQGPFRELRLRIAVPEDATHVDASLRAFHQTLVTMLVSVSVLPSTRFVVISGEGEERKPDFAAQFLPSYSHYDQVKLGISKLTAKLLMTFLNSKPVRGSHIVEVVVDISPGIQVQELQQGEEKAFLVQIENAFQTVLESMRQVVSYQPEELWRGVFELEEAMWRGYRNTVKYLQQEEKLHDYGASVFHNMLEKRPLLHLHMDQDTLEEKGLGNLPIDAQVQVLLGVFRSLYVLGSSLPDDESISAYVAFKSHLELHVGISRTQVIFRKLRFKDPADRSLIVDRLNFDIVAAFSEMLRELQLAEAAQNSRKELILELLEGSTPSEKPFEFSRFRSISSALQSLVFSKNPSFDINGGFTSSRVAGAALRFSGSPPPELVRLATAGVALEELKAAPWLDTEMGREIQLRVTNSEDLEDGPSPAEEEQSQSFITDTIHWTMSKAVTPLPFEVKESVESNGGIQEMVNEIFEDAKRVLLESYPLVEEGSSLSSLDSRAQEKESQLSEDPSASTPSFLTEDALTRSDKASSLDQSSSVEELSTLGVSQSASSTSPPQHFLSDKETRATLRIPPAVRDVQANTGRALQQILDARELIRRGAQGKPEDDQVFAEVSGFVSVVAFKSFIPSIIGDAGPIKQITKLRVSPPAVSSSELLSHSSIETFWHRLSLFRSSIPEGVSPFQFCSHPSLPSLGPEAHLKMMVKGFFKGSILNLSRFLVFPLGGRPAAEKASLIFSAGYLVGENLRQGGMASLGASRIVLEFSEEALKNDQFGKIDVDKEPILLWEMIRARVAAFAWARHSLASITDENNQIFGSFFLDLSQEEEVQKAVIEAFSFIVFESFMHSGSVGRRMVRVSMDQAKPKAGEWLRKWDKSRNIH